MKTTTFLMLIVMLLGIIIGIGVMGILGIIPVYLSESSLIVMTAIFFLIDGIIYFVNKKGL